MNCFRVKFTFTFTFNTNNYNTFRVNISPILTNSIFGQHIFHVDICQFVGMVSLYKQWQIVPSPPTVVTSDQVTGIVTLFFLINNKFIFRLGTVA